MIQEIDLPPELRLAHYRFRLEALEPLFLPPYKGSTLRGGFGQVFRRTVCAQREQESCKECLLHETCPFSRLFDPSPPADSEVLRTHRDVPLPFLLEPPLDRGRRYPAGTELAFGLTLFGKASADLPYFVLVFRELGKRGLGRGRGRYRLADVQAVHPLSGQEATVYAAPGGMMRAQDLSVGAEEISAAASMLPSDRLSIEFLTPARLKHGGHLVDLPEFHVMVRTLLRRVSSLSYFYCGARWYTDYRGWIRRAQAVGLVQDATAWWDWERYSGRQETRLKMGGIVGQAVYEGEIGPFLPLLKLGELAHVGKGTVFGNGLIRAGRG